MNDKPVGVYEKLLFGLFSLGAGILALVTLFILYGVIARNTGLPPFTHTLALTEYGAVIHDDVNTADICASGSLLRL